MILSFVYEKMLKLDEPELGGILGLLWVSLWQWIASDSPDANPMIKDNERQYLRQTIVRKKVFNLMRQNWYAEGMRLL